MTTFHICQCISALMCTHIRTYTYVVRVRVGSVASASCVPRFPTLRTSDQYLARNMPSVIPRIFSPTKTSCEHQCRCVVCFVSRHPCTISKDNVGRFKTTYSRLTTAALPTTPVPSIPSAGSVVVAYGTKIRSIYLVFAGTLPVAAQIFQKVSSRARYEKVIGIMKGGYKPSGGNVYDLGVLHMSVLCYSCFIIFIKATTACSQQRRLY